MSIAVATACPALAGFVLDPNSGTYFSTDMSPRAKPTTLDEQKAAIAYNKALNAALADHNRHFRFFRYWFVGVGAKTASVDQGGNTASQRTGIAGTVGFDFDGLTWPNPYTLEGRGIFGFSQPNGETTVYLYIGTPISKAWLNRDLGTPCPVDADVKRGVPFGEAVLAHDVEIPGWAEQFTPLKIAVGVGYHGVSYEQAGGTIHDRVLGDSYMATRTTTTGMIAGLGYAARLGYYGKWNMLRLTAYYLANNRAKTGAQFSDMFFGGSEIDMDATVRGKMFEAKVDWYHRLDERVRRGRWLSGYGLTLIGRKIHLAEGRTTQARSFLQPSVTTIFPTQDVLQFELLATVGYLR